MENLTIKKVALGVLLVGYAASGAFALTATTGDTIKGRAPLVNKISANAGSDGVSGTENHRNHSVDIYIYDDATPTPALATGSWSDGYEVQLKYKTVDADGDAENNQETVGTVKFGYYKGTSWTWVAATDVSTNGIAKWTIPEAAQGATKLAYSIKPTTEFGAPDTNNWVVGYLDKNTTPEDGGTGGTTNPPTTGGTGGGDTGSGTGPVIPNVNAYTVSIWEATVTNGTLAYTATDVTSSGNPEIGKTYAVKVIRNSDSAVVTGNYSYKWTLTGTAFTVAAVGTDTLTGISATAPAIANVAHKLDVNSTYNSSYKAGAQGFHLKVETL